VVGCGHYCIVGDSLVHNSQETILTTKTTGFMVKIMKQKLEVDNTLLQCSNVIMSYVFIELSDSLACEDLTPPPSSMKLLKHIFKSKAYLLPDPSTHVKSIQSIVFCLRMVVLPKQTSNEL
jgi:hypothetical protein